MILSADLGYGFNKVCLGNHREVRDLYKFPSALAEVHISDLVTDNRAIKFGNACWYVGDDALALQSSSIVDISSYDMLEFAAPIFMEKIIKDLDVVPDIIVIGLSIAQIGNSAHFKKRISDHLKTLGYNVPILLVPQGMAGKLVIEKYGVEFPNKPTEFNKYRNYVGADIGFNTLDIFQVINGEASTNLVRGIPDRGIQVVVKRLCDYIDKECGIKLSINEGKQVLLTGELVRRGKTLDLREEVKTEVARYVQEVMTIIENEFGEILDKTQGLVLFGGGSYYLQGERSDFISIPKELNEFYNAVAFYLHGCNKLEEKK